jgi:hypothetical protein
MRVSLVVNAYGGVHIEQSYCFKWNPLLMGAGLVSLRFVDSSRIPDLQKKNIVIYFCLINLKWKMGVTKTPHKVNIVLISKICFKNNKLDN